MMRGVKDVSSKLKAGQHIDTSYHSTAEEGDVLIIGLDFGTTFSGIAYGFTGTEKPDVHCIMEWPGLEGRQQPKVETLISYREGKDDVFDWGAQARYKKPLVGIKLLLDPTQERSVFANDDKGKAQLERLGKSAEKVASDYIGALYKHANARINTQFPTTYLRRCRRKYVVTVPAVWSDRAKNETLRAARAAGIHPVNLITEPEAAALYTLHAMQDQALKIGDALVICDAGGGTVDLISYEITRLSPRLELKELVPSKGGIAGSLVLNERFESHVQGILGENKFQSLKKKPAWTKALQEFDLHVKTAFQGGTEEEHLVNFPRAGLSDDHKNGLEDNCLALTGTTLHEIFAPVVREIEELVNEQVTLVRDKRLKDNHPQADKDNEVSAPTSTLESASRKRNLIYKIIQPHGAWSAIVKGAVLSQMPSEAAVVSSIATRHYGVKITSDFDQGLDQGQPKWMDGYSGRYKCTKMTWYINTGDDLLRTERISFPFFRTLLADYKEYELIFTDTILTCGKLFPPNHPDTTTVTYVTYVSDLREADRSLFERKKGRDGKQYVLIWFNLTLTPMSGLFRFACEIDGKEYGSVEANYV